MICANTRTPEVTKDIKAQINTDNTYDEQVCGAVRQVRLDSSLPLAAWMEIWRERARGRDRQRTLGP
jgi:hypothetical protein